MLYGVLSSAQETGNQISGVVTDGFSPLSNVSVLIKNSERGVVTNANGKYVIEAQAKDILVFSYIGMKSLEIIIEDMTTLLNIELQPDVEKLDEVVVTKHKRKTQKDLSRTFYSDPTVVSSGYGFLSPEIVGYELRVIDGKDLNKNKYDILDAIVEQLPGTCVRSIEGERLLFFSCSGSLRKSAALVYEIDGQLWPPTEDFMGSLSPTHINIANVLRVALIPGDQAARRYGGIANGGIVIINTNNIVHGEREPGNKPYDQAKLRNNTYANDAVSKKAMRNNEPIYLRELYQAANEVEAAEIYKKQKTNFGSSYVFVLENYRLFREHFKSLKFANSIIEDSQSLFDDNPLALKALAYIKQSYGDLQEANDLYKKVFLLRPDYGQSYIDLANSYREIEQYSKAAAIFSRYNHLIGIKFIEKDTSDFFQIFERDFDNLLELKGKEIMSDTILDNHSFEADFQGTRIVFDWNDGEAEFELQFVNPQGKYFKSEHSMFANANEIQREKQLGYSCKEFLMDGTFPGEWQINGKYLGNRKSTASYIKVTIYHNYGLKTQRKETKVFKLALKYVNQELFKVNNNATTFLR